MQRRSFLKLMNTLFLPFVRGPAKVPAPTLLQDLAYSDSDGNTAFDSLKDGTTAIGGIVYGA
jgi:hypothetical protein